MIHDYLNDEADPSVINSEFEYDERLNESGNESEGEYGNESGNGDEGEDECGEDEGEEESEDGNELGEDIREVCTRDVDGKFCMCYDCYELYEPEKYVDSDDEHFSCHARYEQRISHGSKSQSNFKFFIDETSIAYAHTQEDLDASIYFSLNINSDITIEQFRQCASPSVTHLYFHGGIPLDFCQEIANSFPNLTHLVIFYCTYEGVEIIAKKCSKLEYLSIGSTISDEVLIAIANGCPNFTHLYLQDEHDIDLTDQSVIELANKCPNLKVFSAPKCENLTDESLIYLTEKCPNLTNLNILYNKNVTDALAFAVAKNCPKLKKFIADYCEFSNESLTEIAKNCHELTTVYLYECPNIKNSLTMTFVKNCPNLRMIDIYNPNDDEDNESAHSNQEIEEVIAIRKSCKYFYGFLEEDEY